MDVLRCVHSLFVLLDHGHSTCLSQLVIVNGLPLADLHQLESSIQCQSRGPSTLVTYAYIQYVCTYVHTEVKVVEFA